MVHCFLIFSQGGLSAYVNVEIQIRLIGRKKVAMYCHASPQEGPERHFLVLKSSRMEATMGGPCPVPVQYLSSTCTVQVLYRYGTYLADFGSFVAVFVGVSARSQKAF